MTSVCLEAREQALTAPAQVLCQTCKMIFFEGTAQKFIDDAKKAVQVDYFMLAIRHAWNNQTHNVVTLVVGLDVEAIVPGANISKRMSEYRGKLRNRGLTDLCDNNFDTNFMLSKRRVSCSECFGEYRDLKVACFCHQGMKPFIPFNELSNWPDLPRG